MRTLDPDEARELRADEAREREPEPQDGCRCGAYCWQLTDTLPYADDADGRASATLRVYECRHCGNETEEVGG